MPLVEPLTARSSPTARSRPIPHSRSGGQARRAGAPAAALAPPAQRRSLPLLSRADAAAPKGLYIFGAVGRGKTMLMDLFFETTTFRHEAPRPLPRVHGRRARPHREARKSHAGDPIPQVAAGIAAKTALLCFDELHVTDIADAMILGRLFKALFEAQVVVVATSNVPPRELYKNGLNRQLFVPFIELIEEHMDVVELAAAQAITGWRSWPASRSISRRPMPRPRPRWTGCGPS